MSLSNKAYKGALWSIFQFTGAQFSSTLVLLILASVLGAEAFGLVALAGVYIDFVQILIEQGFAEAIVQRQEIEAEHLNTAFWFGLGTSVLIVSITIIFAGYVAILFQEPQLKNVIQWLSLSFIFRSLNSVQEALLKRDLNFKSLSVRTLGANIAAGITGVTMAYAGFGVWSLVARQLVEVAVGTVLLWTVVRWRPGFKVSSQHFRDLFSYGVNILGNRVAFFFSKRADDFLIGYFLGPVYLGYYTIAYKFIQTANRTISASIGRVVVPAFSRVQDDLVKVRRGFYKVTELMSYATIPFFTVVMLLSSEIILEFLGDEWSNSVPILKILSFYGMLQVILRFNESMMNAMGKPDWSFKINTVFSIFSVTTFMLVVSQGINAVAAVYVVRACLLFPVSALAIKKLIDIDIRRYTIIFVKPICLSLLVGIAVFGLKIMFSDFMNNSLVILGSIIVYMTLSVMFFIRFSPTTFAELRKVLVKRKK
ncbi:MAG: lipopolysaccharide biosynthesis protein [Cyanobacteria bacterium J06581_3]